MPSSENLDPVLSRAGASKIGLVLASWKTWPSWARVNTLACVVGLLSGCLASALFLGVHIFERILWQQPLRIPDGLAGNFELGPWGMALILGIPTFGGLAVGLILKYGCADVAGGGTEQILQSYHHRQARMEGRVVPFKWLASCLTLGTGGAGGNEGPMALIGASTGSWLAQRLDLSTAERGLLFTSGIAGGIGAIFRAPLGGALFACELYYSDPEFESQALVPSLIAAVSAYFVFGLAFGYQALLPGDTLFNLSLVNFVALGITAIICAFGAHAYVGWLNLCSKVFNKALPQPWRPGLGGFSIGVLALGLLLVSQRWLGSDARVLAVLGEGYPILNSMVLAGALPLLLILVAVGKLLASGLTVGSGGSGGVFAPSMIIGGCLGALVFLGLQTLGYSDGNPKAYVLAGMAAFFAAGTACPLASVIIITEVAQGYHILPALMWVVALGYLLRPRPGLFRDQLPRSTDSPVHRAEVQSAFLASRTVGQLCRRDKVASLGTGRPSAQVLRALDGQRCVPVLDAQRRYLGAVRWPLPAGAAPVKTGKALVDPGLSALRTDQNLGAALALLKASRADELPVLDEQGTLVGLFAYHDVVAPA